MAWLFKQDGSKYWWVGYRVGGRQYRQSTKTDDRAQAQKELQRINSMVAAQQAEALTEDVYRALTGRTLPAVTLKLALADWLNEAKGSTAANTLERYNNVAQAFIDHLKADDSHPQKTLRNLLKTAGQQGWTALPTVPMTQTLSLFDLIL